MSKRKVIINNSSDILTDANAKDRFFLDEAKKGELLLSTVDTNEALYGYEGGGEMVKFISEKAIDTTYAKKTDIKESSQSDWTESNEASSSFIKNKPTLGTAAIKNAPSTGDAANDEVVLGNDSRLMTADEKSKLNGIENGAQKNVKPNWEADESAAEGILNKPSIPSKASEINFDGDHAYSGFTGDTVQNSITQIESEIIKNEQTTSASLNDVKKDINSLLNASYSGTVSVDQTIGNAEGTVLIQNNEGNKTFAFSFSGIKGEQGPQGEKGSDGESAYEIAKKNGYTGSTETEWIASLKGEKGDKGDKGTDGKDGAAGKDGTDGMTPHIGDNGNWFIGDNDTEKPSRGAKGEPGEKGTDGASGKDGVTPHIGENGNWYIGETDTNNPSRGAKGETGSQGVGIASVSYTASSDNGGENKFKLNFTNDTESGEFIIKNGAKGDTGAAAGFGTISANISNTADTPKVTLDVSGDNTAKNITFNFSGLKGEPGTGITIKASKDDCSQIGDTYIDENGDLQLLESFSNGSPTFRNCGKIKGPQGADGRGIASVTANESSADGETSTYTFNYTDGSTPLVIKIKNGATGKPGTNGTNGNDGVTPHIGENGNWYIGETNTEKPSRGETGKTGSTFVPSVDDNGTITWVKVDNPQSTPESKNIRGPQGFYFTPSVAENGDLSWMNNGGLSNPSTVNLKGDKGNDGASAGFGTPTASVDTTTGTPSVTVTASGENTAKVFDFKFAGLKGEKGEQGPQGPKGEQGTGINVKASKALCTEEGDAYIDNNTESEKYGHILIYNKSTNTFIDGGMVKGPDGIGISSIEYTSTDKDGEYNKIKFNYTNGTSSEEYLIKNGATGAKGDTGDFYAPVITTQGHGQYLGWEKKSSGDTATIGSVRIDPIYFTPSVAENGDLSWMNNGGLSNPSTVNLKGDKGNDGASAGFGTPTASVDTTTGTPSVTVTASGENTAKVFDFKFAGLKGEKGEQGPQGEKGPDGESAYEIAKKNGYTGSTETEWIASLKGEKGDKGDKGTDGNTPYIGGDGNWFIDSTNTGKPSRGVGVKSITYQSGTTNNSLTFTMTDNGTYGPYSIKNGSDGATPEIGENGNWWINGVDTKKPSQGTGGNVTGITGVTSVISYSRLPKTGTMGITKNKNNPSQLDGVFFVPLYEDPRWYQYVVRFADIGNTGEVNRFGIYQFQPGSDEQYTNTITCRRFHNYIIEYYTTIGYYYSIIGLNDQDSNDRKEYHLSSIQFSGSVDTLKFYRVFNDKVEIITISYDVDNEGTYDTITHNTYQLGGGSSIGDYVESFGEQTGAISIDSGNTENGKVKFSMNGNTLSGEVNGLGDLAYKGTIDSTEIPMSSTETTTVSEKINEINDKISNLDIDKYVKSIGGKSGVVNIDTSKPEITEGNRGHVTFAINDDIGKNNQSTLSAKVEGLGDLAYMDQKDLPSASIDFTINGKAISGSPTIDATEIPMSSTETTTVSEKINAIENSIPDTSGITNSITEINSKITSLDKNITTGTTTTYLIGKTNEGAGKLSDTGTTLNSNDAIYFDSQGLHADGFYERSDENLKWFTGDIPVDFEALKSIPKQFFIWRNRETPTNIGTSAQKVQKVYPELVSESEGHLSVDYAKLSIVALKAIDVLNERIESLEKEIKELKNK